MMAEVVIVDYGLGNVGSIRNMVSKLGHNATVSCDPDQVAEADRIIIGGVGAFDAGAVGLRNQNLDAAILEAASHGSRVLGICLGMQLLMNSSEEGVKSGLGLISGVCRKLVSTPVSRVPNMGWRHLLISRPNAILSEVTSSSRFYFVHSYAVHCDSLEDVSATVSPEGEVVAAIHRENIYGVQFHPEKSHRHGLALLREFCVL